MRILVIPHVASKNLEGESVALVFAEYMKSIKKYAEKNGEKVWFYVVLPRGVTGEKIYEDVGNTTVVFENRRLKQFYTEIDAVDVDTLELFGARTGIYPVDAVITSKTGFALMMTKYLSDFRYAQESLDYLRIPVVIIEDRAFGRKNTHNLVDGVEFMLRAMSYATHYTVFMDEFEFEEAYDASKQYLSKAMLRRFMKHAIMYPGVRCREIDRIIHGVKKREKFTLFWGGRISAQKRPGFVLDVYNRFYELGYDVDIIVTTPHEADVKTDVIPKALRRNSKIKVLYNVSREEYLKLLASSHVFLSGSLYEGFTIGHTEAGYTGVPVIVPNRPWSRLIFGSDYKLMYDPRSEKEALAVLIWCYENYDECVEISRKTRERIRELFDAEKTHEILYNVVKKAYTETVLDNIDQLIIGRGIKEVLDTVISEARSRGYDKISLRMLIMLMKKYMRVSNRWTDPRLGMPSMWALYQYIKNVLGYRDTCDSEEPVFNIEVDN